MDLRLHPQRKHLAAADPPPSADAGARGGDSDSACRQLARPGTRPPRRASRGTSSCSGHHLAPSNRRSHQAAPNGQYVPATVHSFRSPAADYAMSSALRGRLAAGAAALRPGSPPCRARARLRPFFGRRGSRHRDQGRGCASYAAVKTTSLLPRSRLLFMVRDGRDVVDSLIHAATPGSSGSRASPSPRPRVTRNGWGSSGDQAIEWACGTDSVPTGARASPRRFGGWSATRSSSPTRSASWDR